LSDHYSTVQDEHRNLLKLARRSRRQLAVSTTKTLILAGGVTMVLNLLAEEVEEVEVVGEVAVLEVGLAAAVVAVRRSVISSSVHPLTSQNYREAVAVAVEEGEAVGGTRIPTAHPRTKAEHSLPRQRLPLLDGPSKSKKQVLEVGMPMRPPVPPQLLEAGMPTLLRPL